jgi:rfaE bifunctional protein nucleotidyltransferase chain/domain/rfaE bifunctional protein kinase chain/domain
VTTGPLVVVGDSLLDVDLEGRSERLCPDAPVPVVDLDRQRVRPGGAGLAALVAARAGVPVVLVSAVGRDDAGDTLLGLLGNEVDVVAQPLRGQTVVKTRIRTDQAAIVRLDVGDGTAGGGSLTSPARHAIERAGAVLVADYGRGMAWQHDVRDLLRHRPRGVPLVWDPHPRGARPVAGATLLTPNEAEADQVAVGAPDAHARGLDLRHRWEAAAVAVTVGERGAVLTCGRPAVTELLAVPEALRGVGTAVDACGAGDRFASAAAEALRSGQPIRSAVACAVEEAARYVLAGGAGACSSGAGRRLVLPDVLRRSADLTTLIERTRRAGGRVVATGGCFDLLHRGHVDLLQRARALGDLLIVCLNSDDSVRRAKGPDRPVVRQQDRASVLSALTAVDAVAIFDEDTPAALLDRIRPDLWVKGSEYADRILPEAPIVTRHGGRVVLLPMLSGYSTTRLVDAAQFVGAAP